MIMGTGRILHVTCVCIPGVVQSANTGVQLAAMVFHAQVPLRVSVSQGYMHASACSTLSMDIGLVRRVTSVLLEYLDLGALLFALV